MRLLTIDDIIDTFTKFYQRGSNFIFSKLSFNSETRIKSAFNKSAIYSSNWWIIPYIQQRWNKLITGNPNINYEAYFVDKYLKNKKGLKLISLGSGTCSHELKLAKYNVFEEIICVDFVQSRLDEASKIAEKENLNNIQFICADANNMEIKNAYFDIVFFHSSLHHFNHIESFFKNIINKTLKPKGLLVINEYVGKNRLQFNNSQIKAVNQSLKIINKKYRTRYKFNSIKKSFYGSGLIRMIIADPSECIDSENILPTIKKYFKTLEEKPYGGNILMNTLKDISHHFTTLNKEKKQILDDLFDFEDQYLLENHSDFIFGIYEKV